MSWKNKIIKGLLWLFSPETTRPSHPREPNRFLIVSTTGLGDTLWGTPAIRALRQSFPESHIAVLTSEIGYGVLEHNKNIDELFVIGSSPFFSLLRHFAALKRDQFDAILVFHTSQRIVLPFCALLEAEHLIGTKEINKDLDFLFTKGLEKKRQHEIERRLDIVRQVGAYVSDYALEMTTRKEDDQAAQRFLDSHGIPDHIPLIGLHPGAKNTFKQWAPECFIEVGKRLAEQLGAQIFVTGDHSEALLVLEIASRIPGAIPVAGELDLTTFTALLKRMNVFITNDTGPMHLAFAAKTPTVAIFGPTDPYLCGPYHVKNTKVLKTQQTCQPCLKKRCAEPFCMMQIGPDAVYSAAIEAHRFNASPASFITFPSSLNFI